MGKNINDRDIDVYWNILSDFNETDTLIYLIK